MKLCSCYYYLLSARQKADSIIRLISGLDFVLIKSTKALMKREITIVSFVFVLWMHYVLNFEFVFFFKFVSRLYGNVWITYRHHLLRYSWGISLMSFCFSVSIQINHEKNLQIYVLCHSCKCEICSKWCKREIYSKLTIKTPLLLFWCLIVNVSVVNLNRYLSAGIMIF